MIDDDQSLSRGIKSRVYENNKNASYFQTEIFSNRGLGIWRVPEINTGPDQAN